MNKNIILVLILTFLLLVVGCSNQKNIEIKKTEQESSNIQNIPEIVVLATDWEFSPSEINIKVGKSTNIRLISKEGSHGLAIKDLGVDTGVLKEGEEKIITITPTQKGEFPLNCNVYCGGGHKSMIGKIIVE